MIRPCAHASYCPLRMRDGDRPGCNIAIHRGDCQPVVDRHAEVFRDFPARPVDVHEVFLQQRKKSLAS